jgi:large conductance mechanosensitive channel
MLKDFKSFIMRGNVLDLAVAVIIGGAFGQIVSSFVNDIIMPPVGLLLGNVNFKSLYLNLSTTSYPTLADAQAAGAPTINYGTFINNVVDFLIVAAVIFLVVRAVQRLENLRATEAPPPTTKECPYCFSTIPIQATRCAHCTSQLQETQPNPI